MFETRSGSINVLEHIGVHYRQLGVLLLDDATAEVTQAIIEQCSHDTTKIICKIVQKWIQGKGKLPIEWSTLVRVLKDIGLHMLADEMEQNLKDQYWLHVGKKGEAICMCSGVMAYIITHHCRVMAYIILGAGTTTRFIFSCSYPRQGGGEEQGCADRNCGDQKPAGSNRNYNSGTRYIKVTDSFDIHYTFSSVHVLFIYSTHTRS